MNEHIDDNNMPPWFELPKEVRKRVVERMDFEQPTDSELEQCRTELLEHGMYRLIEHFGGNIRNAIKFARRHSVNPEAWPSFEVEDWQLAHSRTKERIAQRANDPVFLRRSARLFAVVREELARYLSSQ